MRIFGISSASLFALALLLAAPTPAAAQLGARSLEVEPFVGIVSFDDGIMGQVLGENAGLESTLGFGARLAYNFTDSWALEGTFNFTPTAQADIQGFDNDEDDEIFDATSVILAHGNLNYNFLLNQARLIPFLTAGGGIASFNVDNDDNVDEDSSTDGEINAGGGLKLFLSETIAVRGDLRNHWIFRSIPNEDPDEGDDEADAETTSNLEFSGGVSLNF